MKRAGELYGQIGTYENIACAFWKASKGKQGRDEVIRFRQNFKAEAAGMMAGLASQSLALGEYRFFDVYDPKPRRICAAGFRERVLHHAVMNICEPVLERAAIHDSYACRKGKGSHRALNRVRFFLQKHDWFLKLDIHKYFDSIDHAIVMKLLERKIKDRSLLSLFDQILDTYQTLPGKGIPIGNLVSQHLANFYLSGFDHWVKESLKVAYVRYMDDFILFGPDRGTLKGMLKQVEGYLSEHLGLRLHEKRQLNRGKLGVVYLGYRVYPGGIRLSSATKSRLIRRCRRYEAVVDHEAISEKELLCAMNSIIAVTRAAESRGFRKKLFERFKGVSTGLQPGDSRRLLHQ